MVNSPLKLGPVNEKIGKETDDQQSPGLQVDRQQTYGELPAIWTLQRPAPAKCDRVTEEQTFGVCHREAQLARSRLETGYDGQISFY